MLAVLLGAYAAVGLYFGIFAIGRIDPLVKASTWGFRLIVLPGVIALWPLLLKKRSS